MIYARVVALVVATAICLGVGISVALRRARSIAWSLLATAFVSVVLMAVAAISSARSMFISEHDIAMLTPMLAMCGVFGAFVGVAVALPMIGDLRRVQRAADAVGSGIEHSPVVVSRRDEIAGVAHSIDRMVARLATLERERSVLLSSISHDLRSPLAALQASVEAVRDGVAPDPDRYLAAMERHVAAMGMLIDDLFLHSRLAVGAVPMAADLLDVGELVHQSAEMIRPVAVARNVEVTVDAPPCSLVGDAAQLGRVIRNLLDNAVRHAAASGGTGCVIVSVAMSLTDITVRVRDSGSGFPTGFRPKAFEPFTRADPARDRNTGTAGLGLSIAREIVCAHHGSIEILPGRGGHLVVTLPRSSR